MADDKQVAYLSMEVGLTAAMPTYSGGLGVLAGDTIRAAADLKVPMVAVTLLHRKGYFHQRLAADGWQTEEPVEWALDDFLAEESARAEVTIEGRAVQLRPWRLDVEGVSGFVVPVYFLDADLPDNSEFDRSLTGTLYGGDKRYRLCQEVILGMGGVRMLDVLGYKNIARFHLNEGHASLCTLELLHRRLASANRNHIEQEDIDAVRHQCAFTTHTPVPAGHDRFPMDLVKRVLGECEAFQQEKVFCCDDQLNLTYLALNLSHFVNGVAKSHGVLSREMFAEYPIDSITNGVHTATWASAAIASLFDQYIPGWREDNFSLRYALNIPGEAIWEAHQHIKRKLIDYVNHETNAGMDIDHLTLGFARRAATYKRADLLFYDLNRLSAVSREIGPIQVIFGGKAHPSDHAGKELIKKIFHARDALGNTVRIAYLSNYDMVLGKFLTSGVDVWLNTPNPPMEASGTSGMKAALNGVPSLSVLDGWWQEGCIEGVTGWAIGPEHYPSDSVERTEQDALSLYDKLANTVVPLFYQDRTRWIAMMRHCIALNGSFFNTQRMIQQYVLKAYFT